MIFPSLFLSQLGSFNPKREKSSLAVAESMDVKVLLESSAWLRSAARAWAVVGLANLSKLERLYE